MRRACCRLYSLNSCQVSARLVSSRKYHVLYICPSTEKCNDFFNSRSSSFWIPTLPGLAESTHCVSMADVLLPVLLIVFLYKYAKSRSFSFLDFTTIPIEGSKQNYFPLTSPTNLNYGIEFMTL